MWTVSNKIRNLDSRKNNNFSVLNPYERATLVCFLLKKKKKHSRLRERKFVTEIFILNHLS